MSNAQSTGLPSKLPSGWTWQSLGDVLKVRNGFAFKSSDYQKSGVLLIRQSNLDGNRVSLEKAEYLPERFLTDQSEFRVAKGDVLIGMSGSIGKLCVYDRDEPALQNQRTGLLQFKDASLKSWIWHYLPLIESKLQEGGKGVGVQNISASQIEALPIPIAPKEHRVQIVAEIEKQFSRLDEAVANLKRTKANLKRYRAAVLKAAVEGRLVPIKNRQTTKIGEVADLVTKGSSPNWQGFDYTNGGVVFVRSQNVGWGNLDLSDVAHLPPAFNDKERKSVLRTGDVLLNIVGASIGRAAVATPEIEGGNVNQAVAVIRLNKERMLPKYLMLNLLSPGTQAAIHSEKVDVARANVSLSDIKEFSVLFPSLAEQGSIVAEVERRLSVIEELEGAVEGNLTRADRLRQSILQQAFSGKLALGEGRGHINPGLDFPIAAESPAMYRTS